MNREEADQFIRERHQAILATIRRSGVPQMSNVSTAYHEGRMLVSITETRDKYRNLQRDPRASLLLLGENFWKYLVVEGRATLIHMPEALPLLHTYYELVSGGPHPDWADYDRAMTEDRRVILSLSIDHIYPVSA